MGLVVKSFSGLMSAVYQLTLHIAHIALLIVLTKGIEYL